MTIANKAKIRYSRKKSNLYGTTSCSDGHLRFQIHTKNEQFVENQPIAMHMQFWFNQV
jgi:hypothetical protein